MDLTADRIDIQPTRTYEGFRLRPGRPFPFGASLVPGGVNFSVFSRHATSCTLVLFEKGALEPYAEIPFPDDFRIGNVFTMVVFDLGYENVEYGFHMDGPFDARSGQRFDPTRILLDPYAKVIAGRDVWGKQPDWNDRYQHRARFIYDDFDWEGDHPLEIPMEDLVIYEAHVRSFTRHPNSGVKHPGTYAGLTARIPYLKELGINCLELLPIFEFDEWENSKPHPDTGQMLMQYWGYSTVGFFAPKAGFAATGKYGMEVDELKSMIKELHRNGIEVMLDVVFNHTAEGNEYGPYISFRGIDNQTYYMLTPDGYYYNFTGCGNTLNCNNPIVRSMVLDCLRYWASEYHIDGFRFDLASVLGRDPFGVPLANPPLLETLAFDPVLAKCKLIAEAWDAGGMYQVGSFPAYGRWAEWNGKYRDGIRRWLKGDAGMVGDLAQRLQGSPDLYSWGNRGPTASINFITAHDGFTLMDLVSYDGKHNWANGENNNDGANDNHSWNHGWEGPTDDPGINDMRHRQIKNALALLLVSQGVPMILMGDEVGRTQDGNNNTYCQDNELSWLDWSLKERNADLLNFARNMIAFRHAHPALRGREHLRNQDYLGTGYADISWHGTQAWQADWSGNSKALACLLNGVYAKGGRASDDFIYVAANTHWDALDFELPVLPQGRQWHVVAKQARLRRKTAIRPGVSHLWAIEGHFLLGPRSVVILVGK